jgi:hypothetical protein
MIATFRLVAVSAVFVLALARPGIAQMPRVEISAAYQVVRASDQTLPLGWNVGTATNLTRRWSIVGEGGGTRRTALDRDLDVDVTLSVRSVGAGLRWSYRGTPSVVPFVQMVAGASEIAARAQILQTRIGGSSTNFMLQPGGGVSIMATGLFGFVARVDYRRVFLDRVNGTQPGANQFNALLGVRIGL